MSEQPKKKGRVFSSVKAVVQTVPQGSISVAQRSITNTMPEASKDDTKPKEQPTSTTPKTVTVAQPKSRKIFGEVKKTTPGPGTTLPPPVTKPVAKPTTVAPKQQEPIVAKKGVRFNNTALEKVKLFTPVTPMTPEPVPKKVVDPVLVKLKAEFDLMLEEQGKEFYEDLDLEQRRDTDQNYEGRQFYYFTVPIEEDFTELNEKLTAIELYPEGFHTDPSDEVQLMLDTATLFDIILKQGEEEEEEEEEEEPVPVAKPTEAVRQTVMSKDLIPLQQDILREEGRLPGETMEERLADKYAVAKPDEGYTPINRRNFSHFIIEKFSGFELPPLPDVIDPSACQTVLQSDRSEMYLYQQFVKEYLSWQTPYRGILVYHGLGSGKTCTSIAAAEALFATAPSKKRIIVMTPASLRQNFIGEITTCGFHHFRLKNHWNSFLLSEPSVRLFAKSVLQIPDSYLAKVNKVWIPDFTKESNYDTLTASQQAEIRDQINAILVFDPKAGLDGRIWFIGYNGISAKDLLEIACKKDSRKTFDDSIIIIDEIHNLIRIMQGTIEPYIVDLEKKRKKEGGEKVTRKLKAEPITWEQWKPELCPADWSAFESNPILRKKNYKRGYLFYRLLIQAQNSKIIGLSGTPLINFPEELGILSNVLHGYVHIIEGNIARPTSKGGKDTDDDKLIQKIIATLKDNPFVDFYDAQKVEQVIRLRATFLPEGIRKVPGKLGVERIDPGEPTVDFAGRLAFLEEDLKAKGIQVIPASKTSTFNVQSQPLLPPVGADFKDIFINSKDLTTIENKILLVKRLTGLISYYRGSRDDLMPKVTKDETLFIPMSAYQQTRYSETRLEEIDMEEESKEAKPEGEEKGMGRLAALYAEVYDIKSGKQTASYRQASRQACNFVFPADVHRPRPGTKEELEQEAGKDVVDILDVVPEQGKDGEDLGASLEKEKKLEDQAKAEDEAIDEEGEKPPTTILIKEKEDDVPVFDEEGKRAEAIEAGFEGKELEDYIAYEREQFEEMYPQVKKKAQTVGKKALTDEEKRCRAVKLEGEDYQKQIDRAKECLRTTGLEKMKMGPTGLGETSPKFQKMLENIAAAKGSSLVYSQYLQLEGIGIFSIAMEVNGYLPIEINYSYKTKQIFFSERTKKDLLRGPGIKQPRYVKFTGEEEGEVRKNALLLFNGRFSELAKDLQKVLTDGGWKNNDLGNLCRVFCITSAGAEGLSLKNVRAVHIMEPYWNDVRMAQVKGRAIRICSHAELPVAERTVDIYTYVSVFSPEAQVARSAPWQIAEKIRNRDSLNELEAKLAKLPIPAGAQQYTLTSDQRLWFISNRKKTLIDNLQGIMKSAAIDCRLNKAENKDVKQCTLFEKSGDFMYDPDFQTDMEKSAFLEQSTKTQAPVKTVATKAVEKPVATTVVKEGSGTYFTGAIDEITYSFEPVFDKTDKTKTVKYLLYDVKDTNHTKVIGEIGAMESKKTKGKWIPDKKSFKLYPKQ